MKYGLLQIIGDVIRFAHDLENKIITLQQDVAGAVQFAIGGGFPGFGPFRHQGNIVLTPCLRGLQRTAHRVCEFHDQARMLERGIQKGIFRGSHL